jgi:myo-inositol-1(or 4)-monophosphatase
MSPSGEHDELLALARQAVHRGGALIRSTAAGGVVDKGDRDLRSSADLASEQAVRDFLARETPDIPILGEKMGGQQAGHGPLWVLDPLDGTINYVHGLPLCAVSLSLFDGKSAAIAVTHLPFLDTTYTAVRGGGTYVNGRRATASNVKSLREALVSLDQYTFTGAHPEDANAGQSGRPKLVAVAECVGGVAGQRATGGRCPGAGSKRDQLKRLQRRS